MIVCANGISTGNMLKREITKMFPRAEVVRVESSSRLKNAQADCELIVSTVKFKSVVPVIQVHPILTGRDKEVLARHLGKNDSFDRVKADDIMNLIAHGIFITLLPAFLSPMLAQIGFVNITCTDVDTVVTGFFFMIIKSIVSIF